MVSRSAGVGSSRLIRPRISGWVIRKLVIYNFTVYCPTIYNTVRVCVTCSVGFLMIPDRPGFLER